MPSAILNPLALVELIAQHPEALARLRRLVEPGGGTAPGSPGPSCITPEEAAHILRCSVGHIRRLYKRGDLTRHGADRRVLLSRTEVMTRAASSD